jgi:hypothetical protein
MALGNDLNSVSYGGSGGGGGGGGGGGSDKTTRSSLLSGAASFAGSAKSNSNSIAGTVGTAAVTSAGRQMEVLKLRELRLTNSEDVVEKFKEASDGYHKVAKRLIDQKRENLMLWGNDVSDI